MHFDQRLLSRNVIYTTVAGENLQMQSCRPRTAITVALAAAWQIIVASSWCQIYFLACLVCQCLSNAGSIYLHPSLIFDSSYSLQLTVIPIVSSTWLQALDRRPTDKVKSSYVPVIIIEKVKQSE